MNLSGTWSDAPSPVSFAGFGEGAPLDVSGCSPADVAAGFRHGRWDDFASHLARVGSCARPIRLRGSSVTVDTSTGEVLGTFTSTDLPGEELLVPCGNRRETACPACSRVYARDTFELIRAGVAGGKQVPVDVGDNPLVFLTLTAPSFGHVHGTRGGRPCRSRSRDGRCEHGRPRGCSTRHDDRDPMLGAPICRDCYDHETAVLWQWHAPELWRRFTIALRRRLAERLGVPDSRLREVASVQYAKVAEAQRRGTIHFHALLRLDGPAERGIGAPAPANIVATDLAALAVEAADATSCTAEPVDDLDVPRVMRFGTQVDARPVRARRRTDSPGEPLSAEQVAGYIAKYATKDAGHDPNRPAAHLEDLRSTCDVLHARAVAYAPETSPYLLLGKWAHTLGFRGHFSTKSRRYSCTLGALRRARRRWQQLAAETRRTGIPLDVADLEARLLADDDDETTLVIGAWIYFGTGWRNETETALAHASAGRAREYAQWRAEQRRNARTTHDER